MAIALLTLSAVITLLVLEERLLQELRYESLLTISEYSRNLSKQINSWMI